LLRIFFANHAAFAALPLKPAFKRFKRWFYDSLPLNLAAYAAKLHMKETKMKYRIPEHITIQTIDNETIKDIIYHELDEQEFLVEYLKNPKLAYWIIDDFGVKKHYKNGELQVTIDGDNVTNHSWIAKHAFNFKMIAP
jgi:hypothetical protein